MSEILTKEEKYTLLEDIHTIAKSFEKISEILECIANSKQEDKEQDTEKNLEDIIF